MFIPSLAIAAIFCIAGGTWLINKLAGTNLCIVCAGVAGTWIILSVGRLLGYTIDPLIIGIMMGGSVVGIMYQIEKRTAQKYISPFLKVLFVTIGLVSIYTFILYFWVPFALSAIALMVTGYGMYRLSFSNEPKGTDKSHVKELTEKMKNCC